MKKQWIGIVLICFFLTACSVDLSKPKGEHQENTLVEYVLKTPGQYLGEGQYFHEVKSISLEKESPYQYVYSGEVKSNAVDRTSEKNKFVVSGFVDSEKWVETYDDSTLNESQLKQVVLLKLPIELGAKWTFKSEDNVGLTHKVQAEITAFDQTTGSVTVIYKSDEGLEEKRLFEKDKGTVKFTRTMNIAKTQLITGYALVRSEKQVLSSFDELVSLTVDSKIPELLRGFIEGLLSNDQETLLTLLSKASPAYEKVTASQETTETWHFQGLKIYDIIEKESEVTVFVIEKYSQSDKLYYNTMQYILTYEDGELRLYDFKPIEKVE